MAQDERVTIRVGIEHRTSYWFDRTVGIGPHTVRLRPAAHCLTPITGYSLQVEPKARQLATRRPRQITWRAWCTPSSPPG
jgi:hypothetical protein